MQANSGRRPDYPSASRYLLSQTEASHWVASLVLNGKDGNDVLLVINVIIDPVRTTVEYAALHRRFCRLIDRVINRAISWKAGEVSQQEANSLHQRLARNIRKCIDCFIGQLDRILRSMLFGIRSLTPHDGPP